MESIEFSNAHSLKMPTGDFKIYAYNRNLQEMLKQNEIYRKCLKIVLNLFKIIFLLPEIYVYKLRCNILFFHQ